MEHVIDRSSRRVLTNPAGVTGELVEMTEDSLAAAVGGRRRYWRRSVSLTRMSWATTSAGCWGEMLTMTMAANRSSNQM